MLKAGNGQKGCAFELPEAQKGSWAERSRFPSTDHCGKECPRDR